MPNTSEDIVYKHLNAINTQDEREYLDSIKFPFTYQNYNGVSITIKDEQDYKVVLAGLYSLTDPILGNVGKGFSIDIFYRD